SMSPARTCPASRQHCRRNSASRALATAVQAAVSSSEPRAVGAPPSRLAIPPVITLPFSRHRAGVPRVRRGFRGELRIVAHFAHWRTCAQAMGITCEVRGVRGVRRALRVAMLRAALGDPFAFVPPLGFGAIPLLGPVPVVEFLAELEQGWKHDPV